MRGSDFISKLPERPDGRRERAILTAVQEGSIAPITWVEVRSELDGCCATLFVSADALRVGDGQDSIRVNVTARTAQQILDHLGCVMPTTRICNLIWDQAAGSIVVEEAGGRVSDLDGKPLDFSHGRTLATNRGVLVTNGPLHEAFLAGLKAIGA